MDSKQIKEQLGTPLNVDKERVTCQVDTEDIFSGETKSYIMVIGFAKETGKVKGIRITD